MRKSIFIFFLSAFPAICLFAQHAKHCPSCQHLKQEIREAYLNWNGQLPLNINSNKRSDSIDILHYAIYLDLLQLNKEFIKGSCTISLVAKMDQIQQITLDLLHFKIDSITVNQKLTTFDYNDTLIQIQFPQRLQKNDSSTLTIYYNGYPEQDKIWGGFYFKAGYAFNLGVGFHANPHSYGRVWYPCFDNFVERATYSFHIKTPLGLSAFCNGQLVSEEQTPQFRQSNWALKTAIPSYLSCITVSNYSVVQQSFQGVSDAVPIQLVAQAKDSSRMKSSFKHLTTAIEAYEYWFGPYRWEKIGYSAVPFNAGAMEHATNIAYPLYALDGTTTHEKLMAHELSHHWWGNWVTCETAEDMWINEGMATYAEHLFWEYLHGKKRYIDEVKKNHYLVLTRAHLREGGYHPISGVPHQYTYGDHVYKKGAVVAHNLRWYLGDTLFRKGMTAILDSFALHSLNSVEMRDFLSRITQKDLHFFFKDWVFSGGFPHYAIDSTDIIPLQQQYKVRLHIQQKLKGAKEYHKHVPLAVSFWNNNWENATCKLVVSGKNSWVESPPISFYPSTVILNEKQQLNQARIDACHKIKKRGVYDMSLAKVENFKVHNLKDSAYVHIAHHLVAPNSRSTHYTISKHRYWSVKGVWDSSFTAEISLSTSASLDSNLFSTYTQSSLCLFYRPSPSASWQEYEDYSIRKNGSVFSVKLNHLQAGDYAFGNSSSDFKKSKINQKLLSSELVISEKESNLLLLCLEADCPHRLFLQMETKDGKIINKQRIRVQKGRNKIQLRNVSKQTNCLKILDKKRRLLVKYSIR